MTAEVKSERYEYIVKKLTDEYENQRTYTEVEEYRKQGALGVLEEIVNYISNETENDVAKED